MPGKTASRVSSWVGFGLFVVLGLLPSLLYGGYLGLMVVRFVLRLDDTGSPTARIVIFSSAGVSVVVTGLAFVLAARAVGRRLRRPDPSKPQDQP